MSEAQNVTCTRSCTWGLRREGHRQERDSNGRKLEASALQRKSVFPSKAAVLERFRGRQPFSSFSAEALQLYTEHGFEALPGEFVLRLHWFN